MSTKKEAVPTSKTEKKTTGRRKTASTKDKNTNKQVSEGGEETIGKREKARFNTGLILMVLSVLMILSFISHLKVGHIDQKLLQIGAWKDYANWIGPLGAYNANYWIDKCFGISAFFIPLFLFILSMKLMRAYKVRLWKWFLNFTILLYWFSISSTFFLSGVFARSPKLNYINPGGQHGEFIVAYMEQIMGSVGLFAVLLLTAVVYLTYISSETINIVRKILNPIGYIRSKLPKRTIVSEYTTDEASTGYDKGMEYALEEIPNPPVHEEEVPTVIDFGLAGDEQSAPLEGEAEVPELTFADEEEEISGTKEDGEDAEPASSELEMTIEQPENEEVADGNSMGALEPYDPKLDLENYKYPVLQLLNRYEEDNVAHIDMEEQTKNKNQIIEVLQNFGVEISSIKATVGPTITLYEITPARGVRIAKIRNLEDDIALSLSALGIRIIAPIPGKGTIGIEVPNTKPQMVSMESILNSKKFQTTEYDLPIALGKTITNEVFMVDLAKMPHLLVAGATGQGKSVGLNAIITSLLYKKHPAELKFVMVDPKKVEFSIYSPIENHFLASIPDNQSEPIITDVNKVVQTLKSLCVEMDSRYDLLRKARARNIKEYNEKFKNRQLNPENGHRFMPYIVVVIDEFGDLIMTAGKEIELPIARIAQLARAVGIHMIIATQRPTTNIITGTIKANFPARMAFKVSAMIDSRTILDRPGANQLIGRGDMLFLAGTDPIRVQCAFVDTPEVERITAYIAKQQSYLGPFELPKVEMESDEDGDMGNVDMTHLDPLFEEAARLIVSSQQGSTSYIQRKFAIGYNRAGRLMDQLERAGIVGAAQGSKPREVLCVDETDLEMRLNNLR